MLEKYRSNLQTIWDTPALPLETFFKRKSTRKPKLARPLKSVIEIWPMSLTILSTIWSISTSRLWKKRRRAVSSRGIPRLKSRDSQCRDQASSLIALCFWISMKTKLWNALRNWREFLLTLLGIRSEQAKRALGNTSQTLMMRLEATPWNINCKGSEKWE